MGWADRFGSVRAPWIARSGVLFLVAALAAGCGGRRTVDAPRERTTAAPATSATPTSVEAPSSEASAAGSAAPEIAPIESWDAEGIAIERLADATIRVRGQDRWGVSLDTVYADVTYFANAVPVLSRSLTEPQARAMTALVPRVRAAAAAPGSVP